VRRVRFHDLRHTFGTRMAASPETSMSESRSGWAHRDYRATLIYADYEPGNEESGKVDERSPDGTYLSIRPELHRHY
jgi:integrase